MTRARDLADGKFANNVTMTSDDPTITMTDSSGTNDIVTIQATSGALIITARDGSADGEIIFKKTDGSATDETLRITSGGLVGIGTSSPATTAHIQTSSGNPELRIESTGANYATMSVKNSSRHYSTQIRTDQSNAYVVRDETAGANRFSIDTSGNVGISTSSPIANLEIEDGGTSNSIITKITADDQNPYALMIGNDSYSTTDTNAFGFLQRNNGDAYIYNAGSLRAVIDSSGIVMTGKTAADFDTAGFQTASNGQTAVTRASATPFFVNRKTDDGTIIEVRKDNTTVGSIGTINGDIFLGTSNTSVRFQDGSNAIIPVTSAGADRDNVIDLGTSAQRFKDLYLSGTAYVDTAVEIHAGLPLKLQNVAGNGFATIQNAGAGTNTDLSFNTAGSEAMRIDSSQRVLIGHTSSIQVEGNQNLQLIGTSSNDGLSIARFNTNFGPYFNFGRSGSGTIGSMAAVPNNDELGRIQWAVADGTDMNSIGASISAFTEQTAASNDVPSRLVFSTTADGASSPTERMRITSGGRLLIGTTAQNAGYGNNNDGMTLTKSGPTVFSNSASDYGLVLNKTSPQSGSTFYQVNFRSANTNVGGIFTNSSSTTYATTSDYRLKEAVVDMTGAIDRVKALAPKRFNFIADPDTTVDGFLAHEAQAVVPEAVTGTHNEVDENGDAVMQAIDQSKLVPLLTGALREAITKIETLETENSTQATQIADLITRVTALEAS
jgi:hypothetical protein